MRSLSNRQVRILAFLGDYIGRHGWAPNYRELAVGSGLASTSSIAYQLVALEARGLIRRGERSSRALSLTDRGWTLCNEIDSAIHRHPAGKARAS